VKLSLVIPCFNEGPNVPKLIKRLNQVFNSNEFQVILVDNGSTDNTKELVNNLLEDNRLIRFLRIEKNLGYGYGILEGLKLAEGDYIGWTHADLQTDPSDALIALNLINHFEEKVFLKGSRMGRTIFDKFFTFSMSIFEFIILGRLMWDINAQPTIFSRDLYETWKNPPIDFSLDLFAFYTAKLNGYSIRRFPVNFPKRIYGTSHWNMDFKSKLKFIKRTLNFSLELKSRLN
tara:strand:- start:8335 stop:9030 length:696 start_codon:yes stop_codon:yes gene_type:complete